MGGTSERTKKARRGSGPKAVLPIESKGQETRLGLLEAAERILFEQGVQALTVRRIGTVSGLAPTLVTYHFGTISGLLAEMCRCNLEPMLEAWKTIDQHEFPTLREALQAWLTPLLIPSAFVQGGRALVVLDEMAAHGDVEFRNLLLTPMLELSNKVQHVLHPFVPHLDAQTLRARVRFLSAATLGPPPRNYRLDIEEGSPPLDGIDHLVDFAVAALEN